LWAHLAHFTVRPFVPKASALTLKRAEHEGQLSIMPDGRSKFWEFIGCRLPSGKVGCALRKVAFRGIVPR
jgi:hypothetical protein